MDAQTAFAEVIENFPRQHLRTRFRNHFGLPDAAFGKETFARGSVQVSLDRRLGHLLQEEPETLEAAVLAGPATELGIDRHRPSSADALASLLTEDRLLIVHGVTARLYAYLPPGESEAWVRRIGVPKEQRPAAKPTGPTLSRRQRAAMAGKRKVVKRSPPRRRP